jgi:nucleoside-diphosphate-sugar epimerase
MSDKQRVFITGASSEVMQRFVARIDASLFEVIGLTRHLGDKTGSIAWVEGDIRDTELISKHLQGCQIVIHAAAVTHSRRPKTYFEINVEATERLVEAAKNNQVQKFIYISSRAAVPDSGAYGVSKLLAEQCVMNKMNNWLVFRLSELFGTASTPDFIMKMVSSALEKRIALCPVNMPSKLFPIYVDDASRIMHDLLFNKNIGNEVITINGMVGYSLRELLQCAGEVCHKKILIIPVSKSIMLSCAKLLEWLSIDIGIAPDQIARLYCVKQHQTMDYGLLSLREFLQSTCNGPSDGF